MLREQIELFYSSDLHSINRQEALQAFNELKFFLNNGEIRSAVPSENGWVVNEWVKKGILLGFRLGELTDVSLDDRFHFYDKNTYPLKKFSLGHQVRIVPGGFPSATAVTSPKASLSCLHHTSIRERM